MSWHALKPQQVPPVTQLDKRDCTLEVHSCFYTLYASFTILSRDETLLQEAGISGQVALVMEDIGER